MNQAKVERNGQVWRFKSERVDRIFSSGLSCGDLPPLIRPDPPLHVHPQRLHTSICLCLLNCDSIKAKTADLSTHRIARMVHASLPNVPPVESTSHLPPLLTGESLDEFHKMLKGELYIAVDPYLMRMRSRCEQLCYGPESLTEAGMSTLTFLSP